MKGTFRYLPLLFLGLYLTTATSCKKKEDDQVCRITNIVAGTAASPTVYSLTYDNNGRLTKSIASGTSGETRLFAYGAGNVTITVSNTATAAFTGTTLLTLNAQGLITSAIEKDATGALKTTTTYTYDTNGKLQTSTFQYASFPAELTTFQFVNGDLTTSTSGSTVSTYSYYTDKAIQDGDFSKIVGFIDNGAYTVLNNHLLKSQTSGSGTPTDFTYQFDASGKITTMNQSNNGTIVNTANYTYTCN